MQKKCCIKKSIKIVLYSYFFQLAVKRKIYPSFWQRSTITLKGLRSKPVWSFEETGSEKMLEELQKNWEIIRDSVMIVVEFQIYQVKFNHFSYPLLFKKNWLFAFFNPAGFWVTFLKFPHSKSLRTVFSKILDLALQKLTDNCLHRLSQKLLKQVELVVEVSR